jgi:hypothetical protein
MPETPQRDLLQVLAPPNAETPAGTLRGEWEGLGAGLEVWCGTHDGWRRLDGPLSAQAGIIRRMSRLYASLTFDLGPAMVRPPHATSEAP